MTGSLCYTAEICTILYISYNKCFFLKRNCSDGPGCCWGTGFFLGGWWAHLRHMQVLRLENESELQLPAFDTAIATPDMHQWPTLQPSAMLDPLTHWLRPGIEATFSWVLVRFLTHWATTGTSEAQLWSVVWYSGLKDLMLPQLQLGFNLWPRNFHMPQVQQ